MRLALCGVLIVLSCILLWRGVQISGQAGVYPIIVTAGAVLFTFAYTVRQALAGGAVHDKGPYAIPLSALPRVAAFGITWTLYVALLPTLGFIIATWLALVASLIIVGRGVGLLQPIWAALFVLVLAVVIKIVLYVPVPQGWLDIQLEIFLFSLR